MKNKIVTKSYFKKRLLEYLNKKKFIEKVIISDILIAFKLVDGDNRKWFISIDLKYKNINFGEKVLIICYYDVSEDGGFHFFVNSRIHSNYHLYTKSMNVIFNIFEVLFHNCEVLENA